MSPKPCWKANGSATRKGPSPAPTVISPGKWKTAENGTIFLNQIDLLSLNMQAKLLRVIERKKIFPLGSTAGGRHRGPFHFFGRQPPSRKRCSRGEFRSDLYFRIATVSIFIPPLRERKNDILPLLQYFCRHIGRHAARRRSRGRYCCIIPGPGISANCENFVIGLSVRGCSLDEKDVWSLLDRPGTILDLIQAGERSLAEVENEYIAYLLRKYKNKSRVARILNISRKSLYNKLKTV